MRGKFLGNARRVISIPPGSSAFVDLLGPPVETGGGTDAVGLRLELGAVRQLGVLKFLDAGEMAVDQHVVGQGPEMLGGLQLGGVDPLCQGK
jgi:hypothetical protein